MHKTLVSIGWGVQSSCIAEMCEVGELPRPDALIFADTGAEPQAVYRHIELMKSLITIPIITVMKNDGLKNNVLNGVGDGASRIAQPPFFVKNGGGKNAGSLMRVCTREFKVEVLEKEVRRQLGFKKGERVKNAHAEQWIGITTDEASRMKPARVKWITNRFPLIELGMSRNDCKKWSAEHGFPPAPKSACYFCPYHSDAFWRDMKINDTKEFENAIEFDAALRVGKLRGVRGEAYLHRSMIPLEDVDFRNLEDRGQINMFINECEGMCGL